MNLQQTSRYYTTQQYTCLFPQKLTEDQEYELDIAIYAVVRTSPDITWDDGILNIQYQTSAPTEDPAELIVTANKVLEIIKDHLEKVKTA